MIYLSRIRLTTLLVSVLFLVSCNETDHSRPNILFIVADDLGYHDLSCMGSQYYETPNIDRIAGNGMIFSNGYATCQVCSPSRASLISGKYPARIGITDWIGAKTGEDWRSVKRQTKLLPADNGTHLPYEYITLPEAMKEGGYATFFAGKWHLGDIGSHPDDHGFDINIGGNHKGSPNGGRYFYPYKNPNMKDYPEEKGMSLSMKLAKECSQFIEDHKDTTFYAHLSFYAVHGPIQTTQEKWRKYRDKAEAMGIRETGFEMERRLPIRSVQDNPVYAGLVEQMDDAVGYVLNVLDSLGLAENTIVIFTSDNGGVASGDAYSSSNLPLRGGKGYQWEGGIREPYFISVPWLNHTGVTNMVPVTGTDFYPTILDLCGLDLRPEEHIDGVSLLPLLKGDRIETRPLYWHYPHYGNQGGDPSSIIREGDWKLIYYWEDLSAELYNLKDDPAEKSNVSEKNQDITSVLTSQLLEWLESVGARYPLPDPEYNEVSSKLSRQAHAEKLIIRRENERRMFLTEGWKPNEDWWGSKVEK